MEHRAFFDIGSNSILCLALAVEDGDPGPRTGRIVYDGATVTGLGRGLSPAGLNVESRERTLEALRNHMRALDTLGGDFRCEGVATSAMRDAQDGAEFAAQIQEELGISVEIISGAREAELTWRAVDASFPDLGEAVVIDIGGGSTEFIAGSGPAIRFRESLNIGSVRLTGRHVDGDPPSAAAVTALHKDARDAIAGLPPLLRGQTGVGSAGTVTTLIALRDGLDPYDPTRVHGKILSLGEVEGLIARLAPLSVAERAALPGLGHARAEVILAGAIILAEAMRALWMKQIIVSDRGLRFGVLAEALPGLVLKA